MARLGAASGQRNRYWRHDITYLRGAAGTAFIIDAENALTTPNCHQPGALMSCMMKLKCASVAPWLSYRSSAHIWREINFLAEIDVQINDKKCRGADTS